MSNVDELVVEVCGRVTRRLSDEGLPGGELRERKHLDPFMKEAFNDATGRRPVSKRFDSEAFAGLGAIDIVAERPPLFMELKWSYERPGKVFESAWDAIKLAILGSEHGREQLYIATGASEEEWGLSECADLFLSGTVDPLEMWQRPLRPRRGPNYGATVGEDLVIGGRGNQPTKGPVSMSVRFLDSFCVAGDFELRLIGVEGTSDLRRWPQIIPA